MINTKILRTRTNRLIKSLRKEKAELSQKGFDTTDYAREIDRLRKRLKRLDRTIERELENLGKEIVKNVVARYLAFEKQTSRGQYGTEPGDTGNLEDLLRTYDDNIEIEINQDTAELGVMSRSFLGDGTPSRGEFPYYIYQAYAISPGGPREKRHFITKASGDLETLQEEDLDLIKEMRDRLEEALLNEGTNR